MSSQDRTLTSQNRHLLRDVILVLALVLIMLTGAYFRLTGVNWDAGHHLHPDERFLSMVLSSISPVQSLEEYFNTELSSLNPANRGYGFFVYGTLPIFVIRYLGEWTGQIGYDRITILGRYVSAIFDVITILIVFFIGKRFRSKGTGLIAACLYALAVLPIQLSHFLTVDTFTNTLGMLTILIGVGILNKHQQTTHRPVDQPEIHSTLKKHLKDILPYLFFGISLGLATASKINAVSLSLFLVFIEVVDYFRYERNERNQRVLLIARNLIVAGLASFITFRIFQPYAFRGPGFFNFGIDPNWWSSMQSLQAQAAGEVDFPPALQWARRPITFAFTNMVNWGMGLPFGIVAWLSFLAMGWVVFRKKANDLLPIWLWTLFYFLWQGLAWVRSMRYQMLVYPLLSIIAAWGLVSLWYRRERLKIWFLTLKPLFFKITSICLLVIIVITTGLWAFSFTRVYAVPHTRVQASDWIYQNVAGPLNLIMDTDQGEYLQPLPYRSGETIFQGKSLRVPFKPFTDLELGGITIPGAVDQDNLDENHVIKASIFDFNDPGNELISAVSERSFKAVEGNWQGTSLDYQFEPAIFLDSSHLYYLEVMVVSGSGHILLNGAPRLSISYNNISTVQDLPKIVDTFSSSDPYAMDIVTNRQGTVRKVSIPSMLDLDLNGDRQTLKLTLSYIRDSVQYQYSSLLSGDYSDLGDGRGAFYEFIFDEPVFVDARQPVNVSIQVVEGDGIFAISSQAPALESSWDDALPLSNEYFYPYSDNGGLYRGDLNFEMYWPDEETKLTRFESILDQADYIFISSNRQYGTIPRVPERYPLSTYYYRSLLGCPQDEDVVKCYNLAVPGLYSSELGFELVKVFESYPAIGNLRFNSQFAEEAFTVYDAPKVLIFKKTSDYDPLKVRELLRQVDLDKVVQVTARQTGELSRLTRDGQISPQNSLTLPENRLAEQKQNGTWSEIFDRQGLLNKWPFIGAMALYLFIALLGLIVYPLVRLALPGLSDRGYPFSRLVGMLLLTFFVWLAGSLGIDYSRLTILAALLLIFVAALVLLLLDRRLVKDELKRNWKNILVVEALSLLVFLVFLYIRYKNPDLWHPYKGGEKPMDFSYLNAILKSSTFPPYDPWFAGGYINYYYYGLMIVSVPIKLLGIVPSVAYNIVLPQLFSIFVIGAYSFGSNLFIGIRKGKIGHTVSQPVKQFSGPFWAGLATAGLLCVLGNLATVRLLIDSITKLGGGGAIIEDTSFIEKITVFSNGLGLFIKQTPLPLYPGDWYWVPSRTIPGEAITEFPFFTFIYADLHAHLIAMPIVVLAVSWGMSFLFSKGQWAARNDKLFWVKTFCGLSLGALIIGALKPANTWDYYTFLVLNLIIMIYTTSKSWLTTGHDKQKFNLQTLLSIIIMPLVLYALIQLFYLPFSYWFRQGFTQLGFWSGDKTPISSYLVHWGLFLFIIVSWLIMETHHWLASTPASALKKMEPFKPLIIAWLVIFLVILLGLLILKVVVAIIVIPLGLWVVFLLLRPHQHDGKRLILFMIGTALILTLVVEVLYLVGDIGRMNIVFKLYNQAWILLGLCSGFCLISLLNSSSRWKSTAQFFWEFVLFSLLVGAAFFPLLGTMDKINDRMAPDAPATLDGMTYMAYATYYDNGMLLELGEDYQAIQWMQDNVKGSPVLVEGQAYEYRWGNRFTIYTGLPGVVGWNWHQRQQKASLMSNIVQERVDQVNQFYLTEDLGYVRSFIAEFDVEYIIVGQLEQTYYPGAGLDKFEQFNGLLWDHVYRQGSTVIYQVRN